MPFQSLPARLLSSSRHLRRQKYQLPSKLLLILNLIILQFNPPTLQGIYNSLGPILDTKFPQNGSDMVLHGLMTDPKQAGDRGVVMAFREATGEFLWARPTIRPSITSTEP